MKQKDNRFLSQRKIQTNTAAIKKYRYTKAVFSISKEKQYLENFIQQEGTKVNNRIKI